MSCIRWGKYVICNTNSMEWIQVAMMFQLKWVKKKRKEKCELICKMTRANDGWCSAKICQRVKFERWYLIKCRGRNSMGVRDPPAEAACFIIMLNLPKTDPLKYSDVWRLISKPDDTCGAVINGRPQPHLCTNALRSDVWCVPRRQNRFQKEPLQNKNGNLGSKQLHPQKTRGRF